jgi:hypothetical protein
MVVEGTVDGKGTKKGLAAANAPTPWRIGEVVRLDRTPMAELGRGLLMAENIHETRSPEPPPEGPPEVPKPTEPTGGTHSDRCGEDQESAHQDARSAALSEFAKAMNATELRVPEAETAGSRDAGQGQQHRQDAQAPGAPDRHAAAGQDVGAGPQRVPDSREADLVRNGGAQLERNRTVDLGDRVTRPTGELGGVPGGNPVRIGSREDDGVRRSLEAENDGAIILADKGYQTKQKPSADEVAHARVQSGETGKPRKNPDYLVEGRVFDCYAPSKPDKDVRGIWSETKLKVDRGQTQRVILNLESWQGNVSDVQRQFDAWPIDNLKEVKAITPNDGIIQIVPNLDED